MKVLTVTLNPTIDVRVNVENFELGGKFYGKSVRNYGGKGINVAKTLKDLGIKTTATGFLGSSNSRGFREYFEENDITDEFVKVEGFTRLATRIEVEKPRSTTIVHDEGFWVPKDRLEKFIKRYEVLVKKHDLIIISGDVPNNVPEDIYADLIDIARDYKKIVFLDTAGNPLRLGLKARPHLIKPSLNELSEINDSELNLKRALSIAKEYVNDGIGTMVVSMGGKGSVWIDSKMQIEATPPTVTVQTQTGAGDAMVAGLAFGYIKGWQAEQIMGFATALAAYTVSRARIGFNELTRIKDLELVTQVKKTKF